MEDLLVVIQVYKTVVLPSMINLVLRGHPRGQRIFVYEQWVVAGQISLRLQSQQEAVMVCAKADA